MSDAPPAEGWRHTHIDEVRFGDLDAMGHLNNAAFLTFYESARIAYLHGLVPEHSPTQPEDFGLIFAECRIRYRSPGRLGQEIATSVRPAALRRSSFEVEFEMRCTATGALLAEGSGVLVGYDYVNECAARLPARLVAALEADGVSSPEPRT